MDLMFRFVNPYFLWQHEVGEMARQGAVGVEDLIRNKVNKIRHWKLTALGKRRDPSGFQFTVMTYNILSQTAVDGHLYLYRKCNPRHLAEEYRVSRILPEILRSHSDVVCLQEVEQHLFDLRIRQVVDSNGFGSVFKRRTGGKSDGCAILWRRAKFSLVSHREVEFHRSGVLDRDNVGLIAVLRPRHPRAADSLLHVATTHLLFNPRRGDVKLCQLRLLLAELERSALKGLDQGGGREYHPTLLCGDFNFEPHSPLYAFVETGRLDVTGMQAGNLSGQNEGKGKGNVVNGTKLSLDGIGIGGSGRFCPDVGPSRRTAKPPSPDSDESSSDSDGASHLFYHDFPFVPAYKYYNQPGDRRALPVTSMTGDECTTVDHIFYGVRRKTSAASFEEGRMRLLGVYTLPRADDLRDIGGMPNAHLGSDHVCLQSKFVIKAERK